jgi:hypothetical protein
MRLRHVYPERRPEAPTLGETMTGVMRFSKGEPLGITGTVVRVESTMVALQLEKPACHCPG